MLLPSDTDGMSACCSTATMSFALLNKGTKDFETNAPKEFFTLRWMRRARFGGLFIHSP